MQIDSPLRDDWIFKLGLQCSVCLFAPGGIYQGWQTNNVIVLNSVMDFEYEQLGTDSIKCWWSQGGLLSWTVTVDLITRRIKILSVTIQLIILLNWLI